MTPQETILYLALTIARLEKENAQLRARVESYIHPATTTDAETNE